jgi:acyl-CoA reductase-like NAD-dependent aldehyde dehydrogenase
VTQIEPRQMTADMMIGGERVAGTDGGYPVHNPARPDEVVGHAPVAGDEQLDAAVAAARRAAPDWSERSLAERAAAIASAGQAAATVLAGLDLAATYVREHGKVRSEAQFELDTAPIIAQLLGGWPRTRWRRSTSTRARRTPESSGSRTASRR